MEIEVKYFTMLREVTGKKREVLAFPDKVISLEVIIKMLEEKYGKAFSKYIYNREKQVRNYLVFMLNNTNTLSLDRFETKIKDGDILSIIPPISGG